ncbi:hypothetical protein N9S40_00070 [Candidatus Pelagibacter sp.]|nr:hypothetical protein [Candidatus Pelagibacter sp.]|tara:strand:- start:938 stop:1171 length:234 start_codon:yes stop_codon:yes gene_type:complete
MKATEANLLSFHILFDTKGRLVTETSGLPIKEVNKVFKGTDLKIIETVIREARRKILNIHNELESELDALNSNVKVN